MTREQSPDQFQMTGLTPEEVVVLGRMVLAAEDLQAADPVDPGLHTPPELREDARTMTKKVEQAFTSYAEADPEASVSIYAFLVASESSNDRYLAGKLARGLFATHPDLVVITMIEASERFSDDLIVDELLNSDLNQKLTPVHRRMIEDRIAFG